MFKLVIIDDEYLSRYAIKMMILRNFDNIEITGEAENGRAAVDLCRVYTPDIVIMDIKMPGMNGLESSKIILSENPDTFIFIFTAYDNFSFAQQAIDIGIKGYILKPVNKDDVLNKLNKAIEEIIQIREKRKCHNAALEYSSRIGNYTFFKEPEYTMMLQLTRLEDEFYEHLRNWNLVQAKASAFAFLECVFSNDFELTIAKEYSIQFIALAKKCARNLRVEGINEICRLSDLAVIADASDAKLWAITSILDIIDCVYAEKLKKDSEHSAIKKACECINNMLYEDITLKSVASQVGLSPQYFSKLFKEVCGKNFIDYITDLRIEKAKELLTQGELDIGAVAEAVGYFDTNYFSRIFKKNIGCTPKQYRKYKV